MWLFFFFYFFNACKPRELELRTHLVVGFNWKIPYKTRGEEEKKTIIFIYAYTYSDV